MQAAFLDGVACAGRLTSVRISQSPSLRLEATPPPRLHRIANQIARLAVNGVVKLRQISRAHTPAALGDRNVLTTILARLVFCQALASPARRSPPGFAYLPSLSFHPRQHREALQLWTVSYDRP
jgi:glycerol-3-phosphate O-acyltransferase